MSHTDILAERYAAAPRRTTPPPTPAVVDVPAAETPLSPRELAVLRGIAAGYTYAQIAEAQHCAEATIASAAKRIYRKMGARCAAHAVSIGWRRGLLGSSTGPSTTVDNRARTGGEGRR